MITTPTTLFIILMLCLLILISFLYKSYQNQYVIIKFSNGKFGIQENNSKRVLDLQRLQYGKISWMNIDNYYISDCQVNDHNYVKTLFDKHRAIIDNRTIIIEKLN